MASDVSTRRDTEPTAAELERLFHEHVDGAFNVAHRVVWNRADAEDVVQTTFVRAFTRLDQIHDPDRTRPWILQIAYRDAIAVLRRRRDIPTDPTLMPEFATEQRSPADRAVANDVSRIVSAALAQMDQSHRVAVVLSDVEELPMAQVGEVLDIGDSAAKMRAHRGRGSLRAILHPKEVVDAL